MSDEIKHLSNITIYTDGSLRKTKEGNICGYGIYFPGKEIRDIAAPFTIRPITNNRAELYAIYRAIKLVRKRYTFDQIVIWTDSEYAQKSLTQWIVSWKKNNWMNGSHKPVENKDIIQKIDTLIQKYKQKIHIRWMPAHRTVNDTHTLNNSMADRLAKQGAEKFRQRLIGGIS